MKFSEAGPVPAQGNIAQQVFWYTAFTADTTKPGLPVVNADGTPKCRVAPSPHGAYLLERLGGGCVDVLVVAGLTSQETSNLVWGYVKYVQSRELRLVWSLCGCVTPRPRSYGPRRAAELEPLVAVPGLRGVVEYSDARLVDGDARFVWDFVSSALSRGAVAVNYVAVTGAERSRTGRAGWRVSLRDVRTGATLEVSARVVVNAAGPLAPEVGELLGAPSRHRLALSKGVHLVVPRLVTRDRVVAMFDDDSRPFFVIPLGDRSMVGTTDTRVDGEAVGDVAVTAEDREFLLAQVNRRLALERSLTSADVVAERAGADWLTLSRRHLVDADMARGVVTVLGGKLTDCVNVGEEILGLMPGFGASVRSVNLWYRAPGLPDAAERRRPAREAPPAFGHPDDEHGAAVIDALWRRQGLRAPRVLAARRADPSSAAEILPGTSLSRTELDPMVRSELVVTAEDLFRRRTLLGQTRSAAELDAAGAVAGLFG
jgi:glycerol-3-phosphate dehydrogenase